MKSKKKGKGEYVRGIDQWNEEMVDNAKLRQKPTVREIGLEDKEEFPGLGWKLIINNL